MIHVSFDLAELTPLQARALGAMLAALESDAPIRLVPGKITLPPPVDYGCPVIPATMRVANASDPDVKEMIAASIVANAPLQMVVETAEEKEVLDEVEAKQGEPAPVEEKAKRHRRTKAEIEADRATTPGHAEDRSLAQAEAQFGASIPAVAPEVPTEDQLRDALNRYVVEHDLPAAKELLKDFGCVRVSGLMERPLVDQLEFLRLANA